MLAIIHRDVINGRGVIDHRGAIIIRVWLIEVSE
jgi:hypothetical protein